MPMYMACPCGFSEHASHGSTFCKDCGRRLKICSDTRDVIYSRVVEKNRKIKELQKEIEKLQND